MVVEVVMPKMGESITEGTILEWRKEIGDPIEMDEILLEIGTDKVDSEIPSANAGILVEILAEPNEVVEVGKVIARIETDSDSAVVKKQEKKPVVESSSKEVVEPDSKKEIVKEEAVVSAPPSIIREQTDKKETSGKRFFTPVVKAIARKEGIRLEELNIISGSGINGRVTKRDLLAYLANKIPETVDSTTSSKMYVESKLIDERVEMNHMRKLIADHMRISLDTSAHVFVMTEVDMTHIVNYVQENGKQFKEDEGFSLTYTPFIVSAVVRALQNYPDMNSSIEETTIVHKKNINIGMAVAVDAGLMVPVIPRCEELNFLGLCRKVRDLAARARSKKIKPDELSGSTFSISNFGIFNVTIGTPIINQPNVGILGVGTIKKKPVVIENADGDAIGIRSMMYLSIGFDHRLIDGAGGAQFIQSIQQNLENMDLEHLF